MDNQQVYERDESFRDSIATVDESGKRKWVFPKKPSGDLYKYRTYLSYFYVALLFAGPWLRIGGEPFLLFNVMERKFVIFGQIFWPQDFYLFALAFITGIVFIILFTVIYGRIFCGWICPQTIFMEMIFRKIEYWIEGDAPKQRKLRSMPWNWEKVRKTGLKHVIFFAISFIIANTFLAYFIGSEQLIAIQFDDPRNHAMSLGLLLIFTTVFYFVFSWLREQVCIAICPYGRLQGVLLDRNSVVVAYDYMRGENRGPFKGKRENRQEVGKGDCIDCHKCVDVCPTGIDIRNGTQLECVNCTACIDACDSIMDKVGFERGLIRYASEEQIEKKAPFRFTFRMKAYSAVLTLLVGVVVALLVIRSDFDTTILRTSGMLFQKLDDGRISNLYNYKIINKTNKDFPVNFRITGLPGEIQFVGTEDLRIQSQGRIEGAMFVIFDPDDLEGMKTKFDIEVYTGDELIEVVDANFLGPPK